MTPPKDGDTRTPAPLVVDAELVEEKKLVKLPAKQETLAKREAKLRDLENDIFETAANMVRDSLRFQDLDPEKLDEIPEEWKQELKGNKTAINKRHRVARAAWMSMKEAPVALSIAKTVMIGVTKARGLENSGDKTINVSMVQMPTPAASYPVLTEDDDSETGKKR